jgi:hypothetical protein
MSIQPMKSLFLQQMLLNATHLSLEETSLKSNFQTPPIYGRRRGRGRGRGRFFASNHLICQICNRIGHIASKCYSKFDHSSHSDSINPAAYLTS